MHVDDDGAPLCFLSPCQTSTPAAIVVVVAAAAAAVAAIASPVSLLHQPLLGSCALAFSGRNSTRAWPRHDRRRAYHQHPLSRAHGCHLPLSNGTTAPLATTNMQAMRQLRLPQRPKRPNLRSNATPSPPKKPHSPNRLASRLPSVLLTLRRRNARVFRRRHNSTRHLSSESPTTTQSLDILN